MRRALPVAALLVLAGCGSASGHSATAAPTADLRPAAAQAYLAAATTANTAKAALQAGPCAKTDNASLKACSSGLADAEQTFENALLAISFPASVTADANALIAVDRRVIASERSFASSANPDSDATDYTAIETADKQLAAAVAALRRDLGLATPPAFATPTPAA
jgi:hypothetical protein